MHSFSVSERDAEEPSCSYSLDTPKSILTLRIFLAA